MRTTLLNSVRARFIATTATVFALVALGGVSAAPAFAYGDMTITISDASTGGPYAENGFVMTPISSGFPSTFATLIDGTREVGTMVSGDYVVNPADLTYVSENTLVTIVDGGNFPSLTFDKYKVEGAVTPGAGAGATAEIQRDVGGWATVSSTPVPVEADDTFLIRLPDGPGTYRLVIHPASSSSYLDTNSDPFIIDGSQAVTSIPLVALGAAATISGSISDYPDGNPLSGATVSASSGGTVVSSAVSQPDGSYLLKFPLVDQTVTVSASASGYQTQVYLTFPFPAGGSPITLDAGNLYSATGINLALPVDPADITGDMNGYAVDTFLYKKDTTSGLYDQTPYLRLQGSSSFDFADLPDGDYRLAFRSVETGRTLVWNSLVNNGTPQSAGSATGDCYVQLSLDASAGDIDLTGIALAQEQIYPATCVHPAYASGSESAVTGSVTNYDIFGYIFFAKLYRADGASGIGTLVDTSQLEYDGSFSLTGVRDNGEYYIVIAPYELSSYLPTLVGDGNYSEWAKDPQTQTDFADNHSFTIDTNDPATLTDHNVAVAQGARLSGSITSDTYGSIDAGLIVTSTVAPFDSVYVPTDGYGNFSVVVPVGGTYTLGAVSTNGDYIDEYWQNATDIADAETVGPVTAGEYGSYEFHLSPASPALQVSLADAGSADPITVYLFQQDARGLWQPIGTASDAAFVDFADLDEGDYRVRFKASDGTWLAASAYRTGVRPDPATTESGPACFIDVPGVTTGFATYVEAEFDSLNQVAVCAAQPPTSGDVTGHLVSSAATGGADIAGVAVSLYDGYNFDFHETVTDLNGDFLFEDLTNGDYSLLITPVLPPDWHVVGTHEYYYSANFTFEGGEDLGDIVPLRFGNAIGQIDGWDMATMSGATATVFENTGCGCGTTWQPIGIPVPIDMDGNFEAPGIADDGDYSVFIDFDGTYVDVFVDGGQFEPTSPFAGTAEQDYTYPSLIHLDFTQLVSISGTAFFEGFPLEYGEVYAETLDGLEYYYAEVDADGHYEVMVPPNVDYLVSVYYDSLLLQYYSGYNYDSSYPGPYTGDTVELGDDSVDGIDFELVAPDEDEFYVSTGTGDPLVAFYTLNDVDVHLYKYVVDGWDEVDIATTFYGANLYGSGGGDYRLRFEKNGEWLRVEQAQWSNYLPPFAESGGFVAVDGCYVDFTDLHHGSNITVDAVLDPDGAASGCGPETLADHHSVYGTLNQTTQFGYDPIPGQTVTLTNSTGYVFTDTTDSFGNFSFEGVSDGNYSFATPSMPVTPGGHNFVGTAFTVTVDDDEDLGAMELVRYGNVEAQIVNYNHTTMAGTTAQVMQLDQGTWQPRGAEVSVSSSGFILAPSITTDGTYSVYVDYPAGFVDGLLTTYTAGDVLSGQGYAEFDLTGLDTYAYTTISGTVRLSATGVSGATVDAENQWGDLYSTITDADGTYSVDVPAGLTYTVEAGKSGLVRDLDTAAAVGFAPLTGEDFSLHYATFLFDVEVQTTPLSGVSTTGVTAHLYRQVAGGWQEIDSDTWSTVQLLANAGGNYRLRFSQGTDWLAVGSYDWTNPRGTDAAEDVIATPAVCFIDIAPAQAGGEYRGTVWVDPSSSVECAAEPAVVTPVTPAASGGTGATKLRGSPATSTSTDAEEEGEEVEPTASPTPTPSPSETEGDDSDKATDVGEPAAASTPDLAWLFWVAGVLVLIVIVGGAFWVIRRRP